MTDEAMEVRDASAGYAPQVGSPVVPQGYRDTEIGVVPEDWEVSAVRQKGEVLAGKALAVNAPGEQRPYLRTKNVLDGRIDTADVLKMPMTDEQFRQFQVRNGDVLLNEGQSLEFVGRCAIYKDEYPGPCAIQNALLRFRARSGVCENFASHLFRHCQQTGVFSRISLQTTSVAHLGSTRFGLLRLAWPTEVEQRAIATALSDADELLETLGRLIAKKRDIKQAAMQQLLTGETRLPGFEGERRSVRLGDHVTFLKNGTHSRAELVDSGEVRYLHYGDIHAADSATLDPAALPFLPSDKAKSLSRLNEGDVIFADASEDIEGVGSSVELVNVGDTEVVAGLHTIAARFDKSVLADGFKAYLQFCPEFISALRRLAAGTKVYATTRSHISGTEMRLPDVEEQRAIAATLKDMDVELDALEQRRAKTAALKQAMMQELLTGRTRLI